MLIVSPGQLHLFAEDSEILLFGAVDGRIEVPSGFGSFGEPAHPTLLAGGAPERLELSGRELLPEAAILA